MTDQAAVSDDREPQERSFDDYFDELNGVKPEDSEDHNNADDDANDDDESNKPVSNDTPNELEELRQLNARLQQERDHFEHSFKSQVGRVSALQKKIDSEPEASAEKEVDADLQGVMNDYPEIAKPIIDYLEKKYADIGSKIAPIEQVEQQRQAQEAKQYISDQLSILDRDNAGWRNTIASTDYNDWLNKQPAPVRQMADSNSATDYQYLLTSYEATQNKSADLTARRQAKLAANVQVPSSGVSKKSTAPDDFDAAWDYYASKNK